MPAPPVLAEDGLRLNDAKGSVRLAPLYTNDSCVLTSGKGSTLGFLSACAFLTNSRTSSRLSPPQAANSRQPVPITTQRHQRSVIIEPRPSNVACVPARHSFWPDRLLPDSGRCAPWPTCAVCHP